MMVAIAILSAATVLIGLFPGALWNVAGLATSALVGEQL